MGQDPENGTMHSLVEVNIHSGNEKLEKMPKGGRTKYIMHFETVLVCRLYFHAKTLGCTKGKEQGIFYQYLQHSTGCVILLSIIVAAEGPFIKVVEVVQTEDA